MIISLCNITSFDKGPSFSFPDFEIDGKSDLIIPVPDSGVPAAIRFSEAINKNVDLGE